jgi:RNA-directed DNA polymerase
MNGKRPKIQYSLALEPQGRGETPVSGHPRAEPFAAKPAPESPAVTDQLMEEVCDRENLQSESCPPASEMVGQIRTGR